MARTPKDVTDAELAVLQVLWESGPSTVRAIAEQLYPGGGNSECATVQKLCERLLAKRFVAGERRSRPRRFRASVDRLELIGRQLESLAERFCAGSYEPLLTHLVERGSLSRAEIESLRSQVEDLDRRRNARRGK